MRDRPDGQVEIVFSRPVLVGIFPERDMAERICAMLRDDEPPLPDDQPTSFGRAIADVREAAEMVVEDAPVRRRTAVTRIEERPVQAVQKRLEPHNLSAAQVTDAFARIQSGEKVGDVATSYGITMGQLRGMWANHKRQAQSHIAASGQQPCSLCTRPFTPSVSHPDTCARCSHD